MFHIRLMLKQMLTTENLPNVREWEETLLKLAMQIARDLVLATGRREMDMDVRRFVKIKRIPGGSPKDSEYVDGAVITKNFAHKRMPRSLVNPRIVFVTFPFDYHRVEGQFVAFDPLVAQEEEYLKNLVSRVFALQPHILLVEKTVTRRALEHLHKYKIAVARNVKWNAIQSVARMTQGDIISSMDRLATDPKLGHCATFKVQTFEHPLIPGKRKTYMRFEGCNRDLGCTILLRGGDIGTLTKVKKVTRFLAFLVRNLKMETFLWKDSVVTMPPLSRYAVPIPPTKFSGAPAQALHPSGATTPVFGGNFMAHLAPPLETIESRQTIEVMDESELPDEDILQLRLSRRIQESIEPYYTTFISVSATIRFPPPYPISKMKELDDQLREAKRAWEDEVVRREERPLAPRHRQDHTITLSSPSEANTSPLETPPIAEEAPSYFEHGLTPSFTQVSVGSFDTTLATFNESMSSDANPTHLKQTTDIARESELALLRHKHNQVQAAWEWYLRRNKDDFVVEKYQRIAYRTYTVPFADIDVQMPCFMPQIKYVAYYGNNDCALGTFIEESCVKYLSMKPGTLCTGGGNASGGGKGCGKPLVGHCHVFVHNQTRLLVATEPWDGTIAGHEGAPGIPADYLTTWSVCRMCGKFTPFIPVSIETQQYSFAKFLELHFYPADVMLMHGAGCEHNIYKHHVRYFAWKGLTVRFQSDPIVLFEPVFPSAKVFIRPDVPLQLKNHDYETLLKRNATFWHSVETRLRWYEGFYTNSLNEKSVDEESSISVTRSLLTKAETAKVRITQAIHSAYSQTFVTDTLAFGKIRQELQDESTLWEKEFEKLDEMRRPPPPTFFDKDLRKSVAIPSRFVKGMFGGTTAGSGSAEKGRSMTEFELESDSFSAHADGETGTAKKPIEDSSSTKELPTVSAAKDIDTAGDSDSTINATQVASRQPSSSNLRSPATDSISETDSKDPKETEEVPETKAEAPVSVQIVVQEASPTPEAVTSPLGSSPSASFLKSRLPRRVKHSPRIAHLVRQFQTGESNPAPFGEQQNIVLSESEQEVEVPAPFRSRPKSRVSQSLGAADAPFSDFEGSYAANVAPMYFAHRRPAGHTSRIPGPILSGSEGPSRKASPERPTIGRTIRFGQGFRSFGAPDESTRPANSDSKGKGNAPSNLSLTANKGHRRANTMGPVTRLTRQWEDMSRDSEKSRRSNQTRNRKARPVATARVTVEVLKTVKEGFRDASESSSSSSEADDEDEDEEPEVRPRPRPPTPTLEKMEPLAPVVDLASSTEELRNGSETQAEPDMHTLLAQQEVTKAEPTQEAPVEKKDPPSPLLEAIKGLERVATLPNLSENEMSHPERSSVFRALSMFQNWSGRAVEKGPDVIYPG
jgi:1-phosphatidylinositol-3-phosphate 5-kinase